MILVIDHALQLTATAALEILIRAVGRDTGIVGGIDGANGQMIGLLVALLIGG